MDYYQGSSLAAEKRALKAKSATEYRKRKDKSTALRMDSTARTDGDGPGLDLALTAMAGDTRSQDPTQAVDHNVLTGVRRRAIPRLTPVPQATKTEQTAGCFTCKLRKAKCDEGKPIWESPLFSTVLVDLANME